MTPKKKAREIDEGLRLDLDRFPRKKVKAFIRSIHIAVAADENFRRRSETERRDKLRELKAAAETYLGTGFQIVRAGPHRLRVDKALRFDPDSAVFVPGLTPGARRAQPESLDAPSQLYRARDRARGAVAEYLRQIEGNLARAEPQKKRRAADATGLLARIADRYAEIFGEQPVTTPGGTFSNLAARILGQDDVSRQVRAALSAHRHRHRQKP